MSTGSVASADRPRRFRRRGKAARAVLALVVVAGCAGRSPHVLTAGDLVRAPERHDGARVVLVGQVQLLRARLSTGEAAYTSFVLADGSGHVPVFGWGTLSIDQGDLVEVRGVFHASRQLGAETVRNTVEAAFVRRLRKAEQLPGPSGPP